ncbi:MAG: transcriptional regulator, partial [Nitrosopumilales archaeon CG_4_9_14_0_8_um_filter_34_10]
MEIAYILIQCDLGAEVQIINEIMKIPEIKEVRGTYGIYDVFCKVQSDTKEELDQIITNKI